MNILKKLFLEKELKQVLSALRQVESEFKKYGYSTSKQPRVKTRGIAASGYTRPTSSDNFIYGLKPVELRQNIKKSVEQCILVSLKGRAKKVLEVNKTTPKMMDIVLSQLLRQTI